MNAATLQAFRELAATLTTGSEAWEWIGPHGQRSFNLTEERAREWERYYGGVARRMEKTR